MDPIRTMLALWQEGFLSSADAIRWADEQIVAAETASPELIDLSLYGPEQCLLRPGDEFPRPAELTFSDLFSLRAARVDVDSYRELEEFVAWLSRMCIGEDLGLPEVLLGYQVDHLWGDCQNMPAAVRHLKSELPQMLNACRARAQRIWKGIG